MNTRGQVAATTSLPLVLLTLSCNVLVPQPKTAFTRTDLMERHVKKMPFVDLSSFSVLYIEDFEFDAPDYRFTNSPDAWIAELPTLFPDSVKNYLIGGHSDLGLVPDPQWSPPSFGEVTRESGSPGEGKLILRGRIDLVRTGSSRFYKHHFDLVVRLLDGTTDKELVSLPIKRSYPANFKYSHFRYSHASNAEGMKSLVRSVARELAMYLNRCKKGTG